MNEEFNHVSLLLQEPLSDEPEALIKDLESIEVWNSRMQFLLAEANSELNRELANKLPIQGTELERKTMQKAKCNITQENRDKLESICDAIKTRITLGQSILRYHAMTNIHYPNNSLREILEK